MGLQEELGQAMLSCQVRCIILRKFFIPIVTYTGLIKGLFKNRPIIKLVLQVLNSVTNCTNSPNWNFVTDNLALPGHACGLPTQPTILYLLDVFRQLQQVDCSNPKDCKTAGCDPYTSVFKSKWLCFPNIRKPNLKNWKSDKAFVDTLMHVSFGELNYIYLSFY